MLVALLLMPLIASAFMMLVRPRVWLEIIHALAALSGLAVGLMVAARVCGARCRERSEDCFAQTGSRR